MKNIFRISGVLLIIFSIILINSCKKDPEVPTITTTAVTAISYASATAGGNVTKEGDGPILLRGICWNTTAEPTFANNVTIESGGLGSFTSNMTQLTPNTLYYVRAYAINVAGEGYGNQLTFTTLQIALPALTTSAISSITLTSAVSGGSITADNGATITARGVCWGTTDNPTTANSKTFNGTGTGNFTSSITGLTSGTTYHVRAYATNSLGTAYGSDISFATNFVTVPTLTTNEASTIGYSTAASGGNVTMDGGAAVTARGVCWSTTENPTIANSKTSNGTGTGTFTSSITGLATATTYHIRAYATNSAGTGYGNDVSFTTNPAAVPILTTTAASSVTSTTATSGGNITSDGGAAVTTRGVCWSTVANPTVADNKTNNGSGTGSFTSSITGLTVNTTYYVRAYATNTVGTAYGNQVSLTTIATIPTLITTSASGITSNTAMSGGNITADNGGTITARGVCWGTTTNPTIIANNKTTDGSGTGSFTSSITGLTANTYYYVRAYATNIAGTAYGNQVTFTTSATVPSLTTTNAFSITQTTARSGGNITSDGGSSVTVRGVCWDIISNPTIASSKTSDGTGTGTYTSTITGLSAGVTYFIRAYSTNSFGTSYGNEVSFITSSIGSTITDIDGNSYNTVTIGSQIWMAENLKTTKYNDGTVIPLVSDGLAWSASTSNAYCWYNNDGPTYINIYGALYNWYTLNTGNVCPAGWHIPTDAEWTTLTTYLLGESAAGGKLKESGNSHWSSPNTGATNETGFSARPGGVRNGSGAFGSIGYGGYCWTSTAFNTSDAWYRGMNYYDSWVDRNYNNKRVGFSVRCLKN
jgi:uncharacterized protein (TIGR02145 family)